MRKRIIIAGDSFTFGHGCSDREFYYDYKTKSWIGTMLAIFDKPSIHSWASLLQEDYPEIEVVNLAKPGRCNQHIFRDLMEYYTNEPFRTDDIVIFSGTFADRIEISSGSYTVPPNIPMSWCLAQHPDTESDIMADPDYTLAKKLYVTQLYDDTIGINMSASALMGAYGYAKSSGAEFLWSLPIIPSPPGVERWPGTMDIPIWKTIPKSFKETNLKIISDFDFSGNNDVEFNLSCRAPDNYINDKGHSIYYEKQIKPVLEKFLNT